MDDENEDNLVKRVVTEISNLTFDPAFVMWDFPLMAEKTWTTTSNVTSILVNETGSEIPVNFTAIVSGKVTEEEVTVPLGTFPCLVIENNISYEVAGVPTSNLEKYWISPTDTGFLCPKSQSYVNGALIELDEQVLRQVGDVVFVPDYVPEPGFTGGPPGKQIATFEVVGAGDATINMVYRSPGGTVEDTFTLNVTAN
jgi:hypothetical protein